VLHTVSFYSNRRGGHLLSSLWAFEGVTCGGGGKGEHQAVTRALGADGIPGATTATLRSGSRRKALQGRWALPVGASERRRPLRTMEGAPGATTGACLEQAPPHSSHVTSP